MRNSLFVVLFGSAALLSGCATSTTMYGPDGKEMQAIECHGSAQSPAACYKKAGEVCGSGGYDILGQNGEAIPTGTVYGQPGMVVAQSGMMIYRTLYVRCKAQAK